MLFQIEQNLTLIFTQSVPLDTGFPYNLNLKSVSFFDSFVQSCSISLSFHVTVSTHVIMFVHTQLVRAEKES